MPMMKQPRTSIDLSGDRSRLDRFMEVIPLNFTENAGQTAWEPLQSSITFMHTGVGDTQDLNYIFAAGQSKDEGLTDMLAGGYFSVNSFFAITSVGFEITGPAQTVVLTTGQVDFSNVGTTLAVQQNTESLTAQFWQAAMKFSSLTYSEDGRTCNLLLGNLGQYPAGIGLENSGVNPANGFPLAANTVCLRRPLVVSPQNINGQGEILQLAINHAGDVPNDPAFAAPAASATVALFLRVLYRGYFCDEQGVPVDDLVERGFAGQYAQSLGLSLDDLAA